MKNTGIILAITFSVISLCSCDWIGGSGHNVPKTDSLNVAVDTTKGIIIPDTLKQSEQAADSLTDQQ